MGRNHKDGLVTPRDFKNRFTAFFENVIKANLKHPVVLTILIAVSFALAFLIVSRGLSYGILGLVALIALPTVYSVIAYPKFGVITILTASYFLMYINKFEINFPVGVLIDGLEALLILGFFIKIKREKNWRIFRNPISFMIIVWIFYNLLQSLNPNAASVMAWLYTIRSVALVMVTYFIFMLHLDDIKFIRLLLTLWISFAFIAAVYAIKQEFFGFSLAETRMLQDPQLYQLYFIDGHWRKFSIFSDPVAFSYNMVTASFLCIGLMFSTDSKVKKIILGMLSLLCMTTMLYSGTRGAYVLIPVGLVLLAILKFNKFVLIYGSIGVVLFGLLIVMPTGDPNIRRFQTAFSPSDDASFNVRKINQKKIQPFIQQNAFGGGLGSTGIWGERFSPESPLSKFPPDSGYVRVAVELGWFGLLLLCTLMFTILRQGIINYYRIQDKELKSICLAMVLIAFALNLGNYPQEALVQFPSNVYFYMVVALINVTWLLDQKKTKMKNA